jgi:MraZ protein
LGLAVGEIREPYRGVALQAVDEKGRVAIPGNFRAALEKNSPAKEIVVGRHPRYPCLMARDLAADAEMHAKTQARREAAEDAGKEFDDELLRRLSSVEPAPFDSSGRFVIPPRFRARSKIEKWALFVAESDSFAIWAPDVLLARPDLPTDLREDCEDLCAARGVSL